MNLTRSASGRLARFVLAALVAGSAAPAAAGIGDWASGAKARVRLIVSGIGEDGRLAVGIEIRLPPGWKTYWRTPGDGGIAPTFDLSGSRNLAAPTVRFPVPDRYDDGYSVSNVYTDRVIFPVSAEVPDASKSVFIVLGVDLGVCAVICVPDRVDVRLIVNPGEQDRVAARLLASAVAALPGPAEPGVLAVDDVARAGGPDKRPVFHFAVTTDDPANAIVFVEGPDDWSSGTPVLVAETTNGADYAVKFSRLVAVTPVDAAEFRVTIVSGDRAVEQTIGLDD